MKNRKFLATFSLSLVVAAATVFCSMPVQAAEITMAKTAAAVTYGNTSSSEAALLRSIFDYEYYKKMNPDVVAKFGDSREALFNHFAKFGIYEGRSLSANFNVSAYASAYPDLKGKFGADIVKYYIHYAAVGSKEDRPITTLKAAADAGITVTSVADPTVVLTPAAIKAAEAKGITDPIAAMAAAPVATSSGSSSSSSGGGGSASTKQNATKTEEKKEETPTEPAATDPINYFDGSGIAHTTYGEFLEIVESTHDTFTVETHNDTEVYVRAGLASAWAAFIAGGSSAPEEITAEQIAADKAALTAAALAATVANRATAADVVSAVQAKVNALTLNCDDWTVASTTYTVAEEDTASTPSVDVTLSSTKASETAFVVTGVTINVEAKPTTPISTGLTATPAAVTLLRDATPVVVKITGMDDVEELETPAVTAAQDAYVSASLTGENIDEVQINVKADATLPTTEVTGKVKVGVLNNHEKYVEIDFTIPAAESSTEPGTDPGEGGEGGDTPSTVAATGIAAADGVSTSLAANVESLDINVAVTPETATDKTFVATVDENAPVTVSGTSEKITVARKDGDAGKATGGTTVTVTLTTNGGTEVTGTISVTVAERAGE